MALPAYSAWLLANDTCLPMEPPETFHHMPCAFKKSIPSWCDQRASRVLMKPLCCRQFLQEPPVLLGDALGFWTVLAGSTWTCPISTLLSTWLHLQYHHWQFSSQALRSHFPNECRGWCELGVSWRHCSSSNYGWVTNTGRVELTQKKSGICIRILKDWPLVPHPHLFIVLLCIPLCYSFLFIQQLALPLDKPGYCLGGGAVPPQVGPR